MDALLKFYVNRVVAKIKKQKPAEEKPGRKKEGRKTR